MDWQIGHPHGSGDAKFSPSTSRPLGLAVRTGTRGGGARISLGSRPGNANTGRDGSRRQRGQGPVPAAHSYPRRMWAGGASRPSRQSGAARSRTLPSRRCSAGRVNPAPLFRVAPPRHHGRRRRRCSERQDLVFRDARASRAAPGTARWTMTWPGPSMPRPLLLFRFSAFTFNGHRIHYDRALCRGGGLSGAPGAWAVAGGADAQSRGAEAGGSAARVSTIAAWRPCSAARASAWPRRGDGCASSAHDGVTTAEGRVRAQET